MSEGVPHPPKSGRVEQIRAHVELIDQWGDQENIRQSEVDRKWLLAEYDRMLAESARLQATAWDEGYDSGGWSDIEPTPNPYRAAQ